ncbi:Anti-anti-sigma regulatory factor (antagonist of anti-sigma factor) [Actinopolymorpha cephalotaxi]|uniref:Anti-anti-sigma regulatory factor n=1 Tax=Actinopolymorpha cephalotaxi TaxID=504797 RepID=A0A1I2NH42_9ACTN|nr:STAS domain-containing protein [Actinopolymorpha cephalotaxi]NYH85552.1 anti-anti-sigma regulatory factor [Actinopolymorpha cephalotaxi]SFG02350.1 Anti-anti-sigma regulatory factor (antagonist of anti-sigma factor) [Actinopolymorpha cephalotaxi]
MGDIEVVDHGDREILVYLRGPIDEALRPRLDAAVERIALLNDIDGHDRVVVDVREVTALEHAGLCFLSALARQGEQRGHDVALAMVNEQTRRALEAAHWPHRPVMSGSR